MLAREVLLIKGKMTRETGFVLDGKEIMPDLYFYRDAEEQEKEEVAEVRGDIKEPPWTAQAPTEAKIEDVCILSKILLHLLLLWLCRIRDCFKNKTSFPLSVLLFSFLFFCS